MNNNKTKVKQLLTIVIMEFIILIITGIFISQFVISYIKAKQQGQQISTIAIFCLVVGILMFVGLNILMIFLIRNQKKKARGY